MGITLIRNPPMANLPADSKLIEKLTEIVLTNLEDENFGVDELAHASGMSLYRLSRRMNSINKKTLNQFIREVRLHKAAEMLKNEELTANEVAFKVGFSSPAYFSKCFHKYFGYPPGKVKKGEVSYVPDKYRRRTVFRILPFILILFIILPALVFFHPEIFKSKSPADYVSPDGKISLVVMPFRNMTGDTLFNVWQEGLQVCLVTSLSGSEELKVRQAETVNSFLKSRSLTDYASITPSTGGEISKKLEAPVFIYGSMYKAGQMVRISAQITNSATNESIKSFQIDGTSEEILYVIDSISSRVKSFLIISGFKGTIPPGLYDQGLKVTNSPEALKLFIQGNKSFYKNDFPAAINWYKQALALDSNLVMAMSKISLSYFNDLNNEEAKAWARKVYNKREKMILRDRLWTDFVYSIFFRTPYERIKSLEELKEVDVQNPLVFFDIGDSYLELQEYEKAIKEFEMALEIFRKRKTKPFWGAFYYELGIAYHKTGQYKKEKMLYRKADADFPDDPGLMDQHAWLELTLGHEDIANDYIAKWTAVRKREAWSDARIADYQAYIYDMAGDTDMVETSLRKALSFEPDNPVRMSKLANMLIDYDRNIKEGMELINKALESDAENFAFLNNKGWGLYKLGRYEEARNILQKSWDLRMKNSIYNHKAYLRLEEASKNVNFNQLK